MILGVALDGFDPWVLASRPNQHATPKPKPDCRLDCHSNQNLSSTMLPARLIFCNRRKVSKQTPYLQPLTAAFRLLWNDLNYHLSEQIGNHSRPERHQFLTISLCGYVTFYNFNLQGANWYNMGKRMAWQQPGLGINRLQMLL